MPKDESDKEEQSSDGGWGSGGENDELPKDKEKKLIDDIFEAITQFTKINNISEADYYALNQNKRIKKKIKPVQQDLSSEKKDQTLTEAKSKKIIGPPPKKQKVAVVANPAVKNYQTNTLSVQHKRRSFVTDYRYVPSQQEYQNFIVYGTPSTEILEPHTFKPVQQTENYNFQEKRAALQPFSNYVFGVLPQDQDNYSPIRQHPQYVLDNAAVKQYKIQKAQSREKQQPQPVPNDTTKGYSAMNFQQQFLQPMTFNFLANQKPQEESKQVSGMRGNKVGRNKYGVSNTILMPQGNSGLGQTRYQGQPYLRKVSRDKLETILTAHEDDQNQERIPSFVGDHKQSLKKSGQNFNCKKAEYDDSEQNFSPRKQIFIEEKYVDRAYITNQITKESIQRSSIKSINNPDGKLPQVGVNIEFKKNTNGLKGLSETNVFSPHTIQHKSDKLRQIPQIQTNPALHDIFVDHLFQTQSNQAGVEERRASQEFHGQNFNSPSHQHYNFNVKKTSKTDQKSKEQAQPVLEDFLNIRSKIKGDAQDYMRNENRIESQFADQSKYAQMMRMNSESGHEYGLRTKEIPKQFKDVKTKP